MDRSLSRQIRSLQESKIDPYSTVLTFRGPSNFCGHFRCIVVHSAVKRVTNPLDSERHRRAIQEAPVAVRENKLSYLLQLIARLPEETILGSNRYSLELPVQIPRFPTLPVGLLHIAVYYDSLECLLFLLSRGYPASTPTPPDYHPIHFAAVGSTTEVASYLVREVRVPLNHRPVNGHSVHSTEVVWMPRSGEASAAGVRQRAREAPAAWRGAGRCAR
jgi:hypothetical protein